MNFKGLKRIMAAALAFCVMSASAPFVLAEETDKLELVFTDVTSTDTTTLQGESKIKVSVKGVTGKASVVETTLKFESNDGVKYKSIQYELGENNPPTCTQISPNAATVNQTGNIKAAIVTDGSGVNLSEGTELFVLTFIGEPGESVTLSCEKDDNTFVTIDGTDVFVDKCSPITTTTSTKDVSGVSSVVKLTMDKVKDFKTANGNRSGIELIISSETTDYSASFTLSDEQRDKSVTTPTFVFENTLVEDTYTVELKGVGYVTYKKTGVTFDEMLNITNADFVPGDINCDGKVNADDKALYNECIANGGTNEAADINRDGIVDGYDNVYTDIKDESQGGSTGGGSTGGGSTGGGTTGGGSTGGGTAGGNKGGSTTTPTIPTTPTTHSTTKTFTDLANYAWAENAIYALKDKGIISGVSNTEYAPASNIKRGDFILILSRMLKLENTFTENFADVPQAMYYYDAIGRAKAAGIATGDGVNFMPEETITRQDLITLAYRAFLNAGYIKEWADYSVLDQFADKAEIESYATAPLASMVAAKIITGDGTNVNPKGFATRAEVAVMCERLLGIMK